ncbi:MAG: SDR family oxidoreductase [Gammaproteobacteria bacterium]|jgi:NAD(P)-dependent dehydrogenase (short-subunit alcohol dehydrogenase family)|nr:short-chain dehydrogenase [Chromatiales bacterium]MDP6675511.1 SDR family oxidoreductase [Gammaproteobacteria bacterium]
MPHAIVTGANRGIGLQLCLALKDRGYRVTALCRQRGDLPAAVGIEIQENYDVTDGAAIEAFARSVEPGTVDLLINNAGILRSTSLDNLDLASARQQFEINALGPLRVTQSLLPALKDGGKIALVTSRMGSIADNDSGGSYGYRMSKAALNAAGMSLARDLHERGIAVAILHPGYVRTDMTGQSGLIDTDESVDGMLERIDELNLSNSGSFWHTNGELLPW